MCLDGKRPTSFLVLVALGTGFGGPGEARDGGCGRYEREIDAPVGSMRHRWLLQRGDPRATELAVAEIVPESLWKPTSYEKWVRHKKVSRYKRERLLVKPQYPAHYRMPTMQ